MDLTSVVASTAEPAFAIDPQHRIVAWNHAAEQLLGFPAGEVLGHSCHLVMCGRDVFGNRFCDDTCALLNMARREEPIGGFELDVRTASGSSLRVRMAAVVLPNPEAEGPAVVHLFHPLGDGSEAADHDPAALSPPPHRDLAGVLTPRETEILRLVADGRSTRDVAETLSISVTTVRNHIQNILRKLDVHSKLEAVSLALRQGLL